MSEHTKGRLLSDDDGVITDTEGRCIASVGCWDDPAGPARTIADTRRLAAAWNACEGIDTGALERIGDNFIKPMIDIQDQRDAAKAELNAARALLLELVAAIEDEQGAMGICEKAHLYLDGCDKPGAPDAS